jgi:transposase
MMNLTEAVKQHLIQTADALKGSDRRAFMARTAQLMGRGGQRLAERELGWSRATIHKGMHELESGIVCLDAFSQRGRLRAEEKDPAILPALERLLSDEVAGDPMGEQTWVRSTPRQLSDRLKKEGHEVSPRTVRRLLKNMGFSLKTNKRKQGRSGCPERDAQFCYIASLRESYTTTGLPIISVDTKKKELIGNFRSEGRVWCKEAPEVDEHDFPSAAEGVAVPFGVYDVTKNTGYVVVGLSHNTPEFAVRAIAKWWQDEGCITYPDADQLLILADGGGANGSRVRAWKLNLQEKLCDQLRLTVTVCHYPTGCSKWNPVEHRLFSQISKNWEGKPLRATGIMLGYIRGTTTTTGLKVKAHLDEGVYEKGKKVTRDDMGKLNLKPHAVCPDWNYTISPSP